jgi:ATP-binding cassette subfamily F protein 3
MLEALADRLAEAGDSATPADVARYGRVQEQFQHQGGYDFHARIDAVLQGLAFDPEEAKTRSVDTLSGGERGRVGLAAQLAAPADLRLLDEPTNHLDLETTRWLTAYVRDYGETIMVISHDRAFLDECADHMLHVHAGTTVAYRGGYSDFVRQRAERELTQARSFAKQQVHIKKEEEYIRRHIAGQNTAQAKGRRRRLVRLPRLSAPPGEDDAMALRLERGERGGDRVIDTKDLRVTVGRRVLLDDVTVTAMRGDVIALVGPNGTGKSTLLATLLGARPPAGGHVKVGAGITPAWYRQDLADVPMDRTIFDVIHDIRPQWTRGHVQNHLGAFQFSGDEVQRLTTSLSGGERSRVALAMITLARANLLVLDEPTNHLDVEGIEVLEDAIEAYEGTVILVSHDRAFLRELATRVWAIEGTRLDDYQGTFVEWEAVQEERRARRAALAAAEARRVRESAKPPPRRPVKNDAAKRTAQRSVEDAERRADAAEVEVAALETQLAKGDLYDGSADGAQHAAELGRTLAQARQRLDKAMADWSRATEELERFEA